MADKTAKFESAQALFCAIADGVGKANIDKVLNLKEYETYPEFKKAHGKKIKDAQNHIDTTADIKEIEEFITTTNSWYISSVKIASHLIKFLSSKVDNDFSPISAKGYLTGKKAINYVRGDKDVMLNLEECWKLANTNTDYLTKTNQVAFGDINKWSPADIYYASGKAKAEIKTHLNFAKSTKGKKSYNFGDLNAIVNGLLDDGELLPLSLKKSEGNTEVKIETVNFDPKVKEKLVDGVGKKGKKIEGGLWYSKHSVYKKWKTPWHIKRMSESPFEPLETSSITHKNNTPTRDMRIYVANNQGRSGEIGNIQIRHEASSNGFKVDFHYKGAGARGGSLVSHTTFSDMLELVAPGVGAKFKSDYEKGREEFNRQMKTNYTNPVIPKGYKHKGKGLNKYKDDNRKDWKRIGYKMANKKTKPTLFPNGDRSGQPGPFTDMRGEVSAIFLLNKCFPDLEKWISANGKKVERGTTSSPVDKFIRILFKYVTSRSESSSKFVIAK